MEAAGTRPQEPSGQTQRLSGSSEGGRKASDTHSSRDADGKKTYPRTGTFAQ